MASPHEHRNPRPPAPAVPGRKRTVAITLLAVGAGAVTIGAISGIGSSQSRSRTFKDIVSCEAENKDGSINCKDEFMSALNSHERSAPAFATRQACEADYGANACTQPSQSSGRGNSFIPAMAAFMIAQRASGGFQSAPLYRNPRDPADEYRQSAAFPYPLTNSGSSSGSSSRSYWSSSGSTASSTSAQSRTATSSPSATTVSRGGFGASAHSSSGS